MGLAHFSIGTATSRIDLLRNVRVVDWEPSETPVEDTWATSAIAEGRQPVYHRHLNAVESMGLHIIAPNQDAVIRWSQDLRRTLLAAREYWDTKHQPDAVYVMARASCETNMRYAYVYAGSLGRDSDPHGQPFSGRGAPRFWERPFAFERGPWMDSLTGSEVDVSGLQDWCFPHHLEFDGLNDWVDCWSDAKLDDIPDNAVAGKGQLTADAWIRPSGWGELNLGRIMDKLNWVFYLHSANGLGAYIDCATQDAYSYSGLDEFSIDGDWHHVLMTYSETGTGLPAARWIYLAVDGAWVTTYFSTHQPSIGNYTSDAAISLHVGNRAAHDRCFEGDVSWSRVSEGILHTPDDGDFDPPERCKLPDIVPTTMGQWIKEGTGTGAGIVENQAGGTDGDLTGATWDCDCPEEFGEGPGAAPSIPPDPLTPNTHVGTFQKPVDPAPVSQRITFGFKPQLLFVWGTGQTSLAFVGVDIISTMGMACLDSGDALHQAGIGWGAEDNVLNDTNTGDGQTNAAIIRQVGFNGAIMAEAVVTAFNDDGFTLNWTTNDANAYHFGFAALRSDLITDATIRSWTAAAGVGAQAVTLVGFPPAAYIDLGGGGGCVATGTSYFQGVGAVDGTNSFGSGWAHSDNYAPAGGVPRAVQDVAAMHYLPTSAAVPGVWNHFTHTSLDGDGFTINKVTHNAPNLCHHTMCLEGGGFATGTFLSSPLAGLQAVGGLPFKPDLGLLFHNAAVSGGVAGAPANPGLGGFDQLFRMGYGQGLDLQANPTDCARWITTSACLSYMVNTAGVLRTATVVSRDPNGFTLWWNAGGVAQPMFYMAFQVS